MTLTTDSLAQIDYPDTDGQPMAESDYQRPYIAYGTEVLNLYFSDQPNVYVSGNLLIYYKKGIPAACVAPDLFVVRGRPKGKRSSYKVWEEEHQYPNFVLEVTSKSTVSEDQVTKRGLYAVWGVSEYFLYDPSSDYLEPSLQGYQLVDGNYVPMVASTLPNEALSITSQVLGLELRLEKGELRFHTLDTGRKLLSHAESETARQQAQDQAERFQSQAERLAAKLRELGVDPDSV